MHTRVFLLLACVLGSAVGASIIGKLCAPGIQNECISSHRSSSSVGDGGDDDTSQAKLLQDYISRYLRRMQQLMSPEGNFAATARNAWAEEDNAQTSSAESRDPEGAYDGKRSYSVEHFRWGKPAGRKRRPVKVWLGEGRTLGEEEEEEDDFLERRRR
ncbi:pro-opiomelanocortin-like [Lethenteron reissneri]|uniref:pro-opiomelanocortin-like n=1 Tax=Lethenteron reissneri TaxID=7753 RepID=UPI002AB5EF3D|nr:pro-opiomelanocortin-like [Lethenteron reissneri]